MSATSRTNTKFSIITPSYLKMYKNSADDRVNKFIRAVDSVINQSYKSWELIIVSDGCDLTIDIYKKMYQMYYPKIQCLSINKQKGNFSGSVRQIGINISKGEYITYLDTDDYFEKNHLSNISSQLKNYDWVYYNNNIGGEIKNIDYYLATTSSITHKNNLNISWDNANGYGHETKVIYDLYKKYSNHAKIKYTGYVVCHTVNGINI